MNQFKIDLPLFVMLPRKTKKDKRIALNLNIYRNLHHMSLNQSKIAFKMAVLGKLTSLPSMDKITLEYALYPKTKRLVDVANVCSIVDKYFCDALVETGKLPDDNYKHLASVVYRFGEVDPINPRCEVLIKEINHV